jgi:hypothetical protein
MTLLVAKFSTDEQRIVTALADNTTRVWDFVIIERSCYADNLIFRVQRSFKLYRKEKLSRITDSS